MIAAITVVGAIATLIITQNVGYAFMCVLFGIIAKIIDEI